MAEKETFCQAKILHVRKTSFSNATRKQADVNKQKISDVYPQNHLL